MQMFTHDELHLSFRKGLRNGNWRKLHRLEKALYMASLWYSRIMGKVVNEMLVGMLSVPMEKLKETSGAKVFRRGFEKVEIRIIVTDDTDFKRVDWSTAVELEAVP